MKQQNLKFESLELADGTLIKDYLTIKAVNFVCQLTE